MSYLKKVEIERKQNRNREIRQRPKQLEKKKKHVAWLVARTGKVPTVKYLGAYRETNKDSGLNEGPWLCKRCKEPLAKQGILRSLFKFTFGKRLSGAVKEHTIEMCVVEKEEE